MTIIKLNVGEDKAKEQSNKLKDLIMSLGGKVLDSNFWGKRKFAYKVINDTEGFYDVVTFELDADKVSTLKSKLNINESILRYLISSAE